MRLRGQSSGDKLGFTIIELVVVVAIIAILATISILGYGAWRTTTLATQVKSDLSSVVSAMENYRTFNNGYPALTGTIVSGCSGTAPATSIQSVLSTITPSKNDCLTLSSDSTTTSYCVDGVSTDNPTATYYVASETKDQGALSGTCATRPGQTLPGVPTGLATTTVASTTVGLTWSAGSGGTPSSYTAQCASDNAFILNFGQATVSSTTATVTGLAASSTHYCRVKATNGAGDSAWSTVISTNTNAYQPPSGFAFNGTTISSITLGWTANIDANTYTLQCATDIGFSSGVVSASVPGATVTWQFNSLPPNTTYYCRINTVNPIGTSAWSSTINSATLNYYGSLAVGTSIEGYWTSAPTGYLLEDGSAVSRTTYSSLFAVIGTTYGAGDGSTTFNVPDSRGKTYVNKLTSDTYFGTLGQSVGSKTVTLLLSQIPLHTHTQYVGNVDDKNFTGYLIAGQYPPGDGPGLYNPGTVTGATGGGGAHNNIQPSIVKKYAIKYAQIDAAASTLPAGSSSHGYWTSAPTGYLLEDGSAVSRTTYATLFSAIGTTYGAGDGSTTFNLPDSRSRASVNLSSTDAEFNTMGEKYGEENHTLSINELPSHNHPVFIGTTDDKNWTGYTTGANQYSPADSGGAPQNTGDVTGNTGSGGSSSFSVVQPSIVQNSAIKYTAATTGSSVAVNVGTSLPGYWASVPSGYLAEDGSAVSRSTYASLFAIIGTTYGAGDGSTTFNLPDSRGCVGVNLNPSDAEFNTMGEKYGEKAHTLTIAEMPSHTHTMSVGTVDDQNFTSGAGQYAPADGGGAYNTGILTGNTGGGQAFNIIQNSIVKLFVIKY